MKADAESLPYKHGKLVSKWREIIKLVKEKKWFIQYISLFFLRDLWEFIYITKFKEFRHSYLEQNLTEYKAF